MPAAMSAARSLHTLANPAFANAALQEPALGATPERPLRDGAALECLRARVAEVVAASRPAGAPWPSGVAALDSALGGGIQRGRITEVVGALGAGRSTLLRQVAARVLERGGWVVWIDARRTAAPQSWAGLGKRLVMVRPPDARRGAWCADQLLRSGVFALVVLDGAPPLQRVQGVRLSGLARDRDAAFVVVVDGTRASRVSGAIRLRIEKHGAGRDFSVIVEKGGSLRTVEVQSAVVMARRVCADSEIPDRRGVARGTRRAWAPRGGYTDDKSPSITWGGLGASVGVEKTSGARAAGNAASSATGDTTRPALPRHAAERADHQLDRRTRDWTTYRGRRRAAESNYGRYSRRDGARAHVERIRTRIAGVGETMERTGS
ncbi:MAG: hypothetical protein ABIW79_09715 [Gemmatimonas sp.]